MKVMVVGKNGLLQDTFVDLIGVKTDMNTIVCSKLLKEKKSKSINEEASYGLTIDEVLKYKLFDLKDNFVLSGYPLSLKQNEFMKSELFKPDLIIFLTKDSYRDEEEYNEYIKLDSIVNTYLNGSATVWKIDLYEDLQKSLNTICEYINYMLN